MVALVLLGVALAGAEPELAPEVSRSAGEWGGVVLLFPRVSPTVREGDPVGVAILVQQALARELAALAPTVPVDVRPAPERVCPEGGCKAVAVGAIVAHEGVRGCAVALTVARPGLAPTLVVPWAGRMEVDPSPVPFREPPEARVRVTDYATCKQVPGLLEAGAEGVRAALRQVLAAERLPVVPAEDPPG